MTGSAPTQRQIPVARGLSAGMSATELRRAVCVARIGNFVRLRRDLGRVRANRLVEFVADQLTRLLAPDRIDIVGRDALEMAIADVSAADLDTAIAAVADLFASPISDDGEEISIELIVGVAATDRSSTDELRLVEEAEAALVEAADSGTPTIRLLDKRTAVFDHADLGRDLVTAIRDGELFLHYQPKVHLRRRQIVSVEALLRWQHPTLGLVSPAEFIPLAEETGDIVALTLWTLRRVIDDQCVMADLGHNLTVYVNIAGVLLADESFVARACELVGEAGVPIGFEITETSVIRDPDSAIANLHRFAAIGIRIAIDDYGAGLSSLAYLKRLPARELKIDKLFITQLTSSHRDPLIVRSTIDLAHALEMEVVAEGVETPSTLALLSVMGCDMAQGFLISRPIGLQPLIQFLNEHRSGWADTPSISPFPMLARKA